MDRAVSFQLSASSFPTRPPIRVSRLLALAGVVLSVVAAGCAHRGGGPPGDLSHYREEGLASWYGEPYHGRRTASGEVYDMYGVSAAHPTLPFGTVVRVTRRDTGASVVAAVNDRGPFVHGRVIDLSYGAARRIDLHRDGIAPVVVETVRGGRPPSAPATGTAPAPCFWVQVGAFSALDNARRSRQRLETMGEPAVVSEGPRGLLRVRSGPFTTRAEAEDALGRLHPGWPEARVFSCAD